jgi:hypothetical protein
MDVKLHKRTEHVPITTKFGDHLDNHGLKGIVLTFYDRATGRDLDREATLEEMGYRGGTLVVGYR